MGNNSILGAYSKTYSGVRIGNNVKIGPDCSLYFGAIIPDNVKILNNSFIDKHCQIQPGETWGGSPARKIK